MKTDKFYFTSFIQRDPRTSLKTKTFYVVLHLVTAMCVVGSATSLYLMLKHECVNWKETSYLKNENYILAAFYIGVIIGLISIFVCIYFLINKNWAWMTTEYRNMKLKPLGQDVEDHDPFVLQREGAYYSNDSKMLSDKIKAETNEVLLNPETEDMYENMDYQYKHI